MHSAALLITAVDCAESAIDFGTRQYLLGVRDAFEAVFRACHGVSDHEDAYAVARRSLEALPEEERVDLLTLAQKLVYARKRSSTIEANASVTVITENSA